MKQAWQKLCETSIVFKGQCQFDHLAKVITSYREKWECVVNNRELLRTSRGGSRAVDEEGDNDHCSWHTSEREENGTAKRQRRSSITGSAASTWSETASRSVPSSSLHTTLEGVAELLVNLSNAATGAGRRAGAAGVRSQHDPATKFSHGANLALGAGAWVPSQEVDETAAYPEALARAHAGMPTPAPFSTSSGMAAGMDPRVSSLLLEEHAEMNRQLQQMNAQLVMALQVLMQQQQQQQQQHAAPFAAPPVHGAAALDHEPTQVQLKAQQACARPVQGGVPAPDKQGPAAVSAGLLATSLPDACDPAAASMAPQALAQAMLLQLQEAPKTQQPIARPDALVMPSMALAHANPVQVGSNTPPAPAGAHAHLLPTAVAGAGTPNPQSLSLLITLEQALAQANTQQVDILGGDNGLASLLCLLAGGGPSWSSVSLPAQTGPAPPLEHTTIHDKSL